MNIDIRQATRGDAAVIADFNVLLALETEDLRLDRAVVEAGVVALLADVAKGVYFVAEVNGHLAGQIMITYEWSDWRNGNLWWIQSVYVKQEFRRLGVFRKLFEYVQVLALNKPEVRSLRLYMHSENATARRSYEKLGMKSTHYEVLELELERS